MPLVHTTAIQRCVERLQAQHPSARQELLELTYDRLMAMLRSMMARYPRVRRWEQSEDVLQNVQIRLLRCFDQVPMTSARVFLGLAALNMRRELIDLSRHYRGVAGLVTHHGMPYEHPQAMPVRAGQVREAATYFEWAELHEHIATLPDEEREIVDLHWYHGLSQAEVAEILGVCLKTVKRRWMSAKVKLAAKLLKHNSE